MNSKRPELDLTIVIVSWNTRELLLDCLRSLDPSRRALAMEIIVIDNASSDDSVDAVARACPHVDLIVNDTNRGFAAAANQGMHRARGRHVLLLNPDARVDPDVPARLVRCADEHPGFGIVGGRISNPDGSAQATPDHFPTLVRLAALTLGLHRLRPRRHGNDAAGGLREVEVASGCCLLIRRRMLEEVGPLDERFFFYAEETDLCERARRAGWSVGVAPCGLVRHVGGASAARLAVPRRLLLDAAIVQLIRKHRGRGRAIAAWWILLGRNLSRAAGHAILSLGRNRIHAERAARHVTTVLRFRLAWPPRVAPERGAVAAAMAPDGARPRVLAVASGGGHWVQLLRLRPAFADADVTWVTVSAAYRDEIDGEAFHVVPDATRWNPLGLVRQATRLLWIVARARPDVIISTGAAPGFFAIRFGRWLGTRTVWLDSMANVDRLSLSGQKAGRFADLWLTQWPDLARPEGPHHLGAVL